MKLSIVIALYNTEQYIERCIQSVLTSPLSKEQYEIIVINDGSTDNSGIIVEQLQRIHSNLILINKENGGQSSARNIGFQIAKGDYIFCLDSDDYIDGALLETVLNKVYEQDLDMYPVKFIKVDDSDNRLPLEDSYSILSSPITGIEFINAFIISGAMARYFYRRKILNDNKLNLIEGIYHEDEEFVIKFLTHVNRISYDGIPLYFYYVREQSTMNNASIEHRKKLIRDLIIVTDSLKELYKKNPLVFGIERKQQQLILSICLGLEKIKGEDSFKKNVLKDLKRKNSFPLKSSQLSFKQKIACIVLNVKNLISAWN